MTEDRILNLSFWISMVRRRRWWILGCTAGVTLVAALLSFTESPVYEATCRLYLNRQRIQPMAFNDLYSKPAIPGRPNELLLTQMEIIVSTPVVEGAVREMESQGKLNFEAVDGGGKPGWLSSVLARLRGRSAAAPMTAEDRRVLYVAGLQDSITVSSSGGNAFLLVTVVGGSPQRTADLANGVADSYLRHDRQLLRHSAEKAADWLNDKVRDQKAKLVQSEDNLRAFAGHPAPRAEEMGELAVQEVSSLQQALLDVRLRLLKAETEGYLGSPTGAPDGGGGGLDREVRDAMRSKVRQELVEASVKLTQLRRNYGEKHPDVLAAADKERQLKDQLLELGAPPAPLAVATGAPAADGGGLSALRHQERALKEQFDKAMRTSASKGQAEITYAILKREAEINRSLYNEMVSRLNEITISAGIDSQMAELFEPARAPGGPISPVHSRDLLLGLFGGLLLGVAVASVREHLDHSVRDAAHAHDLLRAPVLGVVPYQGQSLLAGPGVTQKLAMGANGESPAAEAYRILRSHIEGVLTAEETRTFLLTSAMPEEGKSTTAANIAAAFAEADRKVLLIDGDFRRPSLGRYFKVERKTCLSRVLAGEKKPEEMIRPTEIKRLDFLGCQPGSPLSTSATLSVQFKTLLDWARQRYDHVIVDTPIIMVTPGVTDMARAGAAIVLVHRPGRIPAPVLEQVREHIALARLKLVGVVLNAVRPNWLTNDYAMLPYYASAYYRKPPAQGDASEPS